MPSSSLTAVARERGVLSTVATIVMVFLGLGETAEERRHAAEAARIVVAGGAERVSRTKEKSPHLAKQDREEIWPWKERMSGTLAAAVGQG